MGTPPDALLAREETSGAIVGLAASHRHKREAIGLQVITVRTHRRQGIGSRLLHQVCERARGRGDERVRTRVDLMAHVYAEPFLIANGFLLESSALQIDSLLTVGGDSVIGLRNRLAASGKIPAGARIVETRELPREAALRAYRELIAANLPGRPELAEYIVTSPGFDAAVLTTGDRLAGMLAGVRCDADGVGWLNAVVVAPEFRGGWGWANVLLMAYAFERSLAAGASRLRFEIDESNWKMLQGAGRAQGTIIGRPARFVRELARPAPVSASDRRERS